MESNKRGYEEANGNVTKEDGGAEEKKTPFVYILVHGARKRGLNMEQKESGSSCCPYTQNGI